MLGSAEAAAVEELHVQKTTNSKHGFLGVEGMLYFDFDFGDWKRRKEVLLVFSKRLNERGPGGLYHLLARAEMLALGLGLCPGASSDLWNVAQNRPQPILRLLFLHLRGPCGSPRVGMKGVNGPACRVAGSFSASVDSLSFDCQLEENKTGHCFIPVEGYKPFTARMGR